MRAFVLLGLAALVVAAPLTAARQQTPQFRGRTDIVPIDFLAIDGTGRPVADLTASELVLKVDGQRRDIRSVQFYKVAPTSVEARSTAPTLPPPFGTNDTSTPSRAVIIVVDHTQIKPGEGRGALDAAGRFLDRLAPLDRLGLVTLPDGKVEVDLTTNRIRLQQALRTVIGRAARPTGGISNISLDEALTVQKELLDPDKKFTQELVARECKFASADAFCRTRVVQDALLIARETQRATHASLVALKEFLNGLGGVEGPTTIVYLSSALVEFEETQIDMEDVARAAARARAQIFVIQPHEALLDATTRDQPPSMTLDTNHRLAGLQDLAAVTGGELFRLSGDGDTAFTRIADQISGYYLLGFEPKRAEQNGKPHAIQITTTRPRVTIRTRPMFVADDPNRAAALPLELPSLLRDVASHRGLPLRATAYAFRDRDPRYVKVVVAVEPVEASAKLTSAAFMLVDPTGQKAAQWIEEGADLVMRPVISAAAVPPGDYRLRVAARDGAGRLGTVDYEFAAVLTEAPPLRAGMLMTGWLDSGNFRPRLVLEPGAAAVTGYVELYGVVPPGSTVAVVFEIANGVDGPPLDAAPGRVLSSADPDRLVATGAVPLDKITVGDHTLRAVFSVNGQRVGQVSRTIRKN
jgi:VWFA-related protein